MNQAILNLRKSFSKHFIVASSLVVLLCLSSDSVYFKPIKVLPPITATQIAESCAPAKVITLNDVNLSVGTSWSLGHSYHCLGRHHIVTTINHIGLLSVDKLVSEAIALNYVWLLNQSREVSCSFNIEKIEPLIFENENEGIMFAPYVLGCQNL